MLRSIDYRVQLLAHNEKEIHQYGVCYLHVKCKNCVKLCKFYVVDSKFNPIIGVNSACHLGLLKFTEPMFENWTDITPIKSSELNIDAVHKTTKKLSPDKSLSCDKVEKVSKATRKLSPDKSLSCDKVSKVTKLSNVSNVSDIPETLTREWIIKRQKYKHLFQGIGCFKCNPVSIEMQEGSTPVRKPTRKVPLALCERFKQEIDSMVKAGILTEVTPEISTPEWLNSFMIVKKPHSNLRVCLDPTDLNKHIIHPIYNIRTLEEIIDMLKGSMYFAVFDSTKSFFHVPVDYESKQLTAMLTPIGIYLYNVLAMGLNNATDIFEKCMRNIVDGLQEVVNIADDVLVFAMKYEKFKEHVINFLDRCIEHDLHLNPDKIRINVDSVPFFGQTLMKDGLQMDANKWQVIQNWPQPKNFKELQSFLGSVNYLSKFIPHLSSFRKPLQDLLKSSNEFVWLKVNDEAFKILKNAIVKDVTLKYFDSNLPIYIDNDASKKGIGVVMLQPDNSMENTSHTEVPNNLRPIFYASKTLTATESNYSNIEHEMLGVIFSVLHFKHFTYGREVHIITDHKPLITLFAKNLATTSPRSSQMLIKILDYVVVLHHQEGNKMHLSDAISRLSVHDSDAAKSTVKPIADFNISIHEISEITGFKSLTLPDIKEETIKDCQLTKLKTYTVDGFPKHKHECEDIRSFYDNRESMTIIDGMIMKDKKIVIQFGLREQALENLHRSHMGIVKTKERASTSIFWPKIYKDIENFLSRCHPCMSHKIKQTTEPLEHDIPTKPWCSLTLDNFEYKGSLYLIIYDRFTRHIVVKKCAELSAHSAILSLLEVFCEHGVPSNIHSDRGRNFVSKEFDTFCKDLGIVLNFSSGYHHSANQVECAVRMVKDLMKCCDSAGVH